MREFEVMVHPIMDVHGRMTQIVTLVLDITEQKKNQEQWTQTQKLAAIGQLAAGVAHEINTPLGTINILAEESRNTLHELAIVRECPHALELEEDLETIHVQVKRCKEITQSLLNFSRKADHTISVCSINEILQQALELVRHKMNGIQVIQELAPDLPLICTDVNGVERAIFNLLLNAADAVESNPGTKRIQLATALQDGMISIQVTDNGVGIRQEDLPRIFEPFFTTKAVGKGTGLGLYVTYGTIRDLGGNLLFESKTGAGTRATILLPIDHE